MNQRQPHIKMEMEDCSGFKAGCIAQLCPLDTSVGEKVWYPDEPICQTTSIKKPDWVKTQRKIAKRAISRNTFYAIKALKKIHRVGRGITGVSPDGRHIPHAR